MSARRHTRAHGGNGLASQDGHASRDGHPSENALPTSMRGGLSRILLATNRGPVEFYRAGDGRLATRRGAGGVVTALASLGERLSLTWIATTMTDGDREAFPDTAAPARTVSLGRQSMRVRYVPVSKEMHTRYYNEISNRILWFAQHYLFDLARSPTSPRPPTSTGSRATSPSIR